VSFGTLAGFRMATHGLLACNPCLGLRRCPLRSGWRG
jgi:hypothetical protein